MWSNDPYGAYNEPSYDLPKTVPRPKENNAWMKLCRDPKWNFQKCDSPPELYFATGWESSKGDKGGNLHLPERSSEIKIQFHPTLGVGDGSVDDCIYNDLHPGSLAPKFVFESKAKNESQNDGMEVYIRRLISILCRRFVVISRPSASGSERLEESNGLPQEGTRYWWRYWDNEGNVYQVIMEKFRDSAGTMRARGRFPLETNTCRDLEEATWSHGMPPGDFEPAGDGNMIWMRINASMTSSGKEYTDLGAFFDHAWSFVHHGTTRVHLWDASLHILSGLAGYDEEEKLCRNCRNHVERVLLRCSRCKLVYYCNNGSCQREDWHSHKKMCRYFQKNKA